MNKIPNKQNGFSLVETLIAASILAMVTAGAVSLVNSSLRRSADALDRAVAINLSREAIELLRGARDSTYIDQIFNLQGNPNKWHAPLPFGGPLKLANLRANNITYYRLVPSAEGEVINLGQNDFIRKIYVEKMNFNYPSAVGLSDSNQINQDELVRIVRVEVSWGTESRQKIETKALFTNWRFGN